MQIKPFRENLRKLKPVGKGSPFNAKNPLFHDEEEQPEEPTVDELEQVQEPALAHEAKTSPTPTEVYNKVKDTVTTVLDRLGVRKKWKPELEEIEIESNVE